MQTRLDAKLLATDAGQEADRILRSCVQCGFCTATCPTYQLLGDERDGPRGRIWLIKEMLERDEAGPSTQLHLDRCLTCRACETTCPSGVRYGRLLEIGRERLEEKVPRSWRERLLRRLLLAVVPRPALMRPFLRLGQGLRPVLPERLREVVPLLQTGVGRATDQSGYPRQVILLAGCIQGLATPATNRATQRVLNRLGIGAVEATAAGCCGALPQHMAQPELARAMARRNVDAWWPLLEGGAEALVMTASGCGVQVRDYGVVLADDPEYAERAATIAARTLDLSEFLDVQNLSGWKLAGSPRRVAWHPPCTLQHGQRVTGVVERLLDGIGCVRVPVASSHLCCGAAGSYALLQPEISRQLRDAKLTALTQHAPEVVVTANVGCQMHLAGVAEVTVTHWVELLAEAAPPA
ncbi:MAG: glycolate oxidase subunit GlcF [Gammaproteobacteria bacterium]|nr:glycolate oxidase subunit GlcF [Gammaproteobacteria bacterium]